MKNLVPLLLFLSFNLTAQYKYPKKENADIVLQSTLAVQLLDESDEWGKNANKVVKEAFEENWKLTEVVFCQKRKSTN